MENGRKGEEEIVDVLHILSAAKAARNLVTNPILFSSLFPSSLSSLLLSSFSNLILF
jgi:hypothetical protein